MDTTPRTDRLRLTLLLLFTLSGFSGLAYESVWSHYLKLMLGHAAYAQTLVLAVYMGGMSLGAWLASRSARWRDPLKAYALIEGAVGVSALLFHPVFVASDGWLHASVLPLLGGADQSLVAATLARWSLGALLMLPQAVLLGMTFPLMSAAVLRLDRARGGETVGALYFTNCLGAAIGVLIAAFVLVPAVGLPGTLLVAGLANLLVAGVAWLAGADATRAPVAESAAPAGSAAPRLLLAAAAITGLASFIYEIAWIRMLSLVLGSTMQAFELMLAAFLLGLALGGLWVRKRADAHPDPARLGGRVQVAMGCFALLTLPVYAWSFDGMAAWMGALAHSDGGYAMFLLGSHGIALLVMLPATVMAGMTLPLFTAAVMRAGSGEAGVGRVYALNTLGCIAGALVAVHLLLPAIGTRGAVALGAALDIGLGLALLAARRERGATLAGSRELLAATALGVGLLAAVLVLHQPDPLKLASGVYRFGQARLPEGTEVLMQRDGKTATVALLRGADGTIDLRTNGKSDASLGPDPAAPGHDSVTMVLSGALPLALRPEASTVANIGLGSGITTHTLLAHPGLERVDTIEIEAAMVEGARGFGPAVARAFEDPRSRIHIDDAKAWFAAHAARYDVIVSEPSNPWVSGVASLFTREFYARIKQHLAPGGVLVQWLQLYSADLPLTASVLKALAAEFPDYAIYATDDLNIVIVASDGAVGALDPWVFEEEALRAALAPIGVRSPGDLELRLIGRAAQLAPLFASFEVPANSDYFPYLSLNAPKARFLMRDASALTALRVHPVPIVGWLSGAPPRADWAPAATGYLRAAARAHAADALAAALLARRAPSAAAVTDERVRWAAALALAACTGAAPQFEVDAALDVLAGALNPYLAPQRLAPLWDGLVPARCRERWPEDSQLGYALQAAIGGWDHATAERLAETLLPRSLESPPAAQRLATIALAAKLARGDRAAAARAWNGYGGAVAQATGMPLELRWLGALALAEGLAPPRRNNVN